MPEALTASKQLLPRQALDQPNPLGRTGPVASRHLQAQRTAQGIAKCMDVGGRPTAKEAGRWRLPFFALWNPPGVPCTRSVPASASCDRALAKRAIGLCNSRSFQRAERWYTGPMGMGMGHGPRGKGQRQVMPGPAGIGDPECADNGSAGQPARGSAQPGVTPPTRKLLSVLRVFLEMFRTHLGVFQPSSPGRACAGSY